MKILVEMLEAKQKELNKKLKPILMVLKLREKPKQTLSSHQKLVLGKERSMAYQSKLLQVSTNKN